MTRVIGAWLVAAEVALVAMLLACHCLFHYGWPRTLLYAVLAALVAAMTQFRSGRAPARS